jgi:hypothetical protein
MLEKDGEDYLDRCCDKLGSITHSQGEKKHATYDKKKEG